MQDDFDIVHAELAKQGKCDTTGSVEYERVKREWIEAGKPSNIKDFICWRSNLAPASGQAGFSFN